MESGIFGRGNPRENLINWIVEGDWGRIVEPLSIYCLAESGGSTIEVTITFLSGDIGNYTYVVD